MTSEPKVSDYTLEAVEDPSSELKYKVRYDEVAMQRMADNLAENQKQIAVLQGCIDLLLATQNTIRKAMDGVLDFDGVPGFRDELIEQGYPVELTERFLRGEAI